MSSVRRCIAWLTAIAAAVVAYAAAADDNALVFEIGGAGEWDVRTSASHFGPNVAVEVTPIDHWLEIELGATRFLVGGAAEWESDLVFKKPFELSSTADLMIGLGPTWTHSSGQGGRANSAGGEAALDFMIWPRPHWGWYVEPAYGIAFDHGHRDSVGVTAGLLIGLP